MAFETILIKNGLGQNLAYHERRMNQTRRQFFCATDDISIEFDSNLNDGRCKIIYNLDIQRIEFAPYIKQKIDRLKFVNADIIYSAKWLDRSDINALADDAIIVKDGLIQDTKIANIAFFDGMRWLTPASPLLNPTTRARLIDDGFLQIANLRQADIMPHYKIAVMNALRGFEEIGIARNIIV